VTTLGFERVDDARDGAAAVSLDESQRAVLDLEDDASAAVLGAPGSGKTSTIVELVAHRVRDRGWAPDEIVVLTPTRASATRLRDRLALRLAAVTTSATNGPLARTVNSLAFEVTGTAAVAAGGEPLRLITGGDQDLDIGALLEGHALGGGGPRWPEELGPDVRRLRGFRTELRDFMMRATEYDISPQRMRALGDGNGRPEWVAAADFVDEYLDVISAARPSHLDAAELAQFAVAALVTPSPGERIERLRLVIVDDLQEATESTLAILRALGRRGIAIIAFGDPDVAANAFRGGEPDALGRLGAVLGDPGIRTLTLRQVHRQGDQLRALTSAITERVGTAAAGSQRRARATGEAGDQPLAQIQAATPGRQLAAIARELRERHLLHGVAWSDLAVITRSGAQLAGIRRALALAEVPARTAVGGTALRDDRAARALLTVVDVGSGRTALTADLATEMLLGPFGGFDKLALRRLRLALRAEEISGGGNRGSDDLLVEALSGQGRFATIDHRIGRSADRLAQTLASLAERAELRDTIEELLWLAWERSGVAAVWLDQALSAGITSAEANANLDGILALFTAAKRFVERRPDDEAVLFLDAVLGADVPEDTLTPQANDDAVLVTTPSGAVGLEFDTVVVTGLQEGAWPNRRLRGSLLGAADLVRASQGLDSATIDDRKLVLDDELRMFALAVSRARRRVVLAAISNDDDSASVFLSLLPADTPIRDSSGLAPLSLRGYTGMLRRDLTSGGQAQSRDAAAALERLAAAHVPGAHPSDWHGLIEPSTREPLYLETERVPVSPSQLEKFEASPLDWFIESIAGGTPSSAMGLGTIMHWAMETALDADVDQLWEAVESRWGELLFESDWLAEREKRAARILAAGIAEYLADFRRDGKTLVGAESRFTLAIDQADVNGSIDRVERSADGAVVIVDLKTGRPLTAQTAVDAHPQLGVYQLAYAQGVLDEFLADLGEHHSGGAKLLYVREGKGSKLYREGIQVSLDDDQLEGFRTRIRQAAAGMALAEFEGVRDLTSWTGASNSLSIHRVKAVSSD
jgi:superfamily I DNA/RNA helicase/RecB family exonuclease